MPASAPFATSATGETAAFIDQQSSLASRLPLGIILLAALTMTILFLLTGSVVLPLKSIVMNILTLSAAFGLLVVIFQDGNLQGPLGFTSQDALEIATQPILLAVLVFGLSTDYAVFLLARIKEAHDTGLENREAVAVGLERTGRIVSAAALLFCVAIGAFATSKIIFIKEVGVGTALAVIIDATIIRALLVPSLMALLGDRNWWAPAPLRRIHRRFGIDERASRHSDVNALRYASLVLAGVLAGSELTSRLIVHPALWRLPHAAQVKAEKAMYGRDSRSTRS